jgi:hypothetical protein
MTEAKLTPETTTSFTRYHSDSTTPVPGDVTKITETRSTVTTSTQPDTLTGIKKHEFLTYLLYLFASSYKMP